MAYQDRRYEKDRYQQDDDRNLMQKIKQDVKNWFDFDDDDDRNQVRNYDFQDRSGRRYRGRDENDFSDFGQDRDVKQPGNTYTGYGSGGTYQGTGRGRSYYQANREYDREYDRSRSYNQGDRDFSSRRLDEDEWNQSRASGRDRGYQDQSPGQGYSRTYLEAWIIPGPYIGAGPKGFKRSSESLKERVCERLQSDGRVDASGIEVKVDENCEVTLEGEVQDRRQKRLAEDCVDTLPGIEDVHNRLKVSRRTGESSSQFSTEAYGAGSADGERAKSTRTSTPGNRKNS